jgi:hypothetical protein
MNQRKTINGVSGRPVKIYFKRITKSKVTKAVIESFVFTADPFSLFTHAAISGAFAFIHSMFTSISEKVSFTSIPAAVASIENLVRWTGVLIASANNAKVSLNETLK